MFDNLKKEALQMKKKRDEERRQKEDKNSNYHNSIKAKSEKILAEKNK